MWLLYVHFLFLCLNDTCRTRLPCPVYRIESWGHCVRPRTEELGIRYRDCVAEYLGPRTILILEVWHLLHATFDLHLQKLIGTRDAHCNTGACDAHCNTGAWDAHCNTGAWDAHCNTGAWDAHCNTGAWDAHCNTGAWDAHCNTEACDAHCNTGAWDAHCNTGACDAHCNTGACDAHCNTGACDAHCNTGACDAHAENHFVLFLMLNPCFGSTHAKDLHKVVIITTITN